MRIDAAALKVDELVQLLAKAGSKCATPELVQQHLAAGAPTNGDGTVHLLHFTAWLAKQSDQK